MKIIGNHTFLHKNCCWEHHLNIELYNPYLIKSFKKYNVKNENELVLITNKDAKKIDGINFVNDIYLFNQIKIEHKKLFENYGYNPKIFKFFLLEKSIIDNDFYLLIDTRDTIFNNYNFKEFSLNYKDCILPSMEWSSHFFVREWIQKQLFKLVPNRIEELNQNTYHVCTGLLAGQGYIFKQFLKDFCLYVEKLLFDLKFPKIDADYSLSEAGFGDQCLFNLFLIDNKRYPNLVMDHNLNFLVNLNQCPENQLQIVNDDYYELILENSYIKYRPLALHHTEYHSKTSRENKYIKSIKWY